MSSWNLCHEISFLLYFISEWNWSDRTPWETAFWLQTKSQWSTSWLYYHSHTWPTRGCPHGAPHCQGRGAQLPIKIKNAKYSSKNLPAQEIHPSKFSTLPGSFLWDKWWWDLGKILFAANNTGQKGQKEIRLQVTQVTVKYALFEPPFLWTAPHPPPATLSTV